MHKTRKSINQQQLASLNLKVITIWQPFASLITFEKKIFETRPKPTKHIGGNNWYLIHSAKKWDKEVKNICTLESFKTTLEEIGISEGILNTTGGTWVNEDFPLGHIIAIAQVKRCLKSKGYRLDEDDIPFAYLYNELNRPVMRVDGDELTFGDYNNGRYAWQFTNIMMVEPFLYKGGQGYYRPFVGNTNQIRLMI